jgi:hypothetical protein
MKFIASWQAANRISHAPRKPTTECRSRDELEGAKGQRYQRRLLANPVTFHNGKILGQSAMKLSCGYKKTEIYRDDPEFRAELFLS